MQHSMVLKGIGDSTAFGVQFRLARWAALEAAMRPEILLRTFAQRTFHPLVDPNAIGLFRLAGKAFERGMNHQSITAAVSQALLGERHHQRLAQACEFAGGGDSRRLNPEQRHEDTLLGAVVLIRCVPDRSPCAQQFEHAPHVIAFHRQRVKVVPLAASALDEVEQRILVFAVHAIDGVLLTEQRCADLQRGEVHSHQNHALALRLSLFQILQAFDMGQFRQTLARPPPAHGHLEEGDAGGREVFLEQAFALGSGFFRETQLKIALGNAPSVAGHSVHQCTQGATDRQ
ncbi:hypothetical protein EMIT0180MI3_360043 [Priestia megaterium]